MDFAKVDANELMGEDNMDVPISSKILDISKKALPGVLIVILLLLLTLRSMGLRKKKTGLSNTERKKLVEKIDKELDKLSEEDSGLEYGDGNIALEEKDASSNFFAPRYERLSKEEKRKKIMEIRKKVLSKMDETIYPELKEIVSFESNENPQAAAKTIRNWLTGNN
jgi:flagellar biosynthesis/type III secretory pathway M-ring protein FliF/YscJ